MREHGWDIWAAITRCQTDGVPAFLTWYEAQDIFAGESSPAVRPGFNHPLQKTLGLGDAILSYNTYNAFMRDHILSLGYQNRANLNSLVSKAKAVENFPDRAIMTKTVWWPVRSDGLTALPVWDESPTRDPRWGRGVAQKVSRGDFPELTDSARATLASHELHGNDFETFARVVAVDPSPGTGEGEVRFFDPDSLDFEIRTDRMGRIVRLQDLYHQRLEDPALVADLNTLPDIDDLTVKNWGRPLQVGDYLALVAVHVATRETDDWVWATYWWHDQPQQDTGSDRSDRVRGIWRNYKMRVAYNGIEPKQPDGRPHVAYNPYLEAGFSGGLQSNCVSCHQRAVIHQDGKMGEVFPVPEGQLPDDDPFFDNKLKLDFVWSLATRTK